MSRAAIVVLLSMPALAACTKKPIEDPPPSTWAPSAVRDPVPPVFALPVAAVDPEPAHAVAVPVHDPPQDYEDAESCALPAKCMASAVDADTTLRMSRTACFGSCPVYTVTLHGDGAVEWKGEEHVATKGSASAKVDPKKVRELVDLVTTSCFLAMREVYFMPVTDHPWANTTLTIGGRSKMVRHNLGALPPGVTSIALPGFCSPPAPLDTIEAKIDAVAGTAKWIGSGAKK